MNIIVTGGKGFIGTNIIKGLSDGENRIYSWDRDGIYLDGKIVKKTDLLNPISVESVIGEIQPDAIYNCAGSASVSYSVENPFGDFESNYLLLHNLLFSLKKLKGKCRFFQFSSAAVYGNPLYLPIDENHDVNPLSPYALHKKAAEDVCFFMMKNYGIDVKVIRIFSVYGPGQRKQIFWDMFQKYKATGKLEMFGTGNESRDYIYIDDLVDAVMRISKTAENENVFNVANGVEVTIRDVAFCFARLLGISDDVITFNGTIREGDPINWCADISRLQSTGYVRRVSFEEGLQRYIHWAENINEG